MTPAHGEYIGGLIEVPMLAACLTLNKGDFIRSGQRGATYLGFRKAIQEAVSKQLALWGDEPVATEVTPPKEVQPLRRDLAAVLEELALDFPLLSSLVEQRAGGQKRLPLGTGAKIADGAAFVSVAIAEQAEGYQSTPPIDAVNCDRETPQDTPPTTEDDRGIPGSSGGNAIVLPGQPGPRRPAHYGLDIQFEDRDDDLAMGRLVESTVWVNRAHPAYHRALASRSIGYHIALAVALALAPLAVEAGHEMKFVNIFLSHWGDAVNKPRARAHKARS